MSKRETIEMVDGRVYFSDDNWQTVYVMRPSGKTSKVDGRQADLARFLRPGLSKAMMRYVALAWAIGFVVLFLWWTW